MKASSEHQKAKLRSRIPLGLVGLGICLFMLLVELVFFINLEDKNDFGIGNAIVSWVFFCGAFACSCLIIVSLRTIKKIDSSDLSSLKETLTKLEGATLDSLPIVQNPQGILLGRNEKVYYQCGAKESTYNRAWNNAGWLTITNKRVVLTTQAGGFEDPICDISWVYPTNEGISINCGDKKHFVILDDGPVVAQIIKIVVAGVKNPQ